MPYDPRFIANVFLTLGDRHDILPMRLQKLVFLAHGWHLASKSDTARPLVEGRIEARDGGPAHVILAAHEKSYSRDRDGLIEIVPGGNNAVSLSGDLNPNERDIIERVWQRYGHYTTVELTEMLQAEGTPWSNAYFGKGRNARIKDEDIEAYFLRLGLAGRISEPA